MDIYDFIAQRITHFRMKAGLSERQLSETIGKSPNYIQQVVSKRGKPPLDMLEDICKVFDISLSEFFDDKLCSPELIRQATEILKQLDDTDVQRIMAVAERFPKRPVK